MKYTYSDIGESCSWKEYIDQYRPIKLELNKVYIQGKGTWQEMHYKITFCDDSIALGVKVYSAISMQFIGDYELFYVDNGFKYQDMQAPSYRLTEEFKK